MLNSCIKDDLTSIHILSMYWGGLQKWVQWRPLSTDVLAFPQFQQTFLFGYQVVNQPAESVGYRFCMFKLFYVCM